MVQELRMNMSLRHNLKPHLFCDVLTWAVKEGKEWWGQLVTNMVLYIFQWHLFIYLLAYLVLLSGSVYRTQFTLTYRTKK